MSENSGWAGAGERGLGQGARLRAILSEHGLADDARAREGEARSEWIDRLAESFRLAQEKTRGEFFDALALSPQKVSDWFYEKSWRGAALLRAGFSPMRYEKLCDQSSCYDRLSRASPEYREITLTALAQGWKPDTSDMAGMGFECHPISKAIWIWVGKNQPEQTCKDVIEALVAASPMYGPEWVGPAMRAIGEGASGEERKTIELHVKGLLMARDQQAELEKVALEAQARPKKRSSSL